MSTNIPYLDEVWNLTRGCTKVSAGCKNCYAERLLRRFCTDTLTGDYRFDGFKADCPIELCDDKVLDRPLHWRRPRRVGVCFMSDLFHEKVDDLFILEVWLVMAMAQEHTFLVLTKRPERMRDLLRDNFLPSMRDRGVFAADFWPLPNVWLGVSVENQQAADERIPLLLDTPAAHRWLSVEPLLEAVDLRRVSPGLLGTSAIFDALGGRRWEDNGETLNATACARLDWVVVGGESGPNARPMKVEWMSDLQQQCLRADVPFYCKQDSGPRPGMQGRIPLSLWAVKDLPESWA